MLKQIRSGIAERTSKNPPSKSFYIWIPSHAWRSAGLTPWNIYGPRYLSFKNSTIQQYGNFNWPSLDGDIEISGNDFILSILRNSTFFRLISSIPQEKLNDKQHYAVKVLADIIAAANQDLRLRYNSELIVIAWSDVSTLSFDTIKALQKRGITVLDKQNLLDNHWDDRYLIEGDGHPTAQANSEVALSLARRYGQCDSSLID